MTFGAEADVLDVSQRETHGVPGHGTAIRHSELEEGARPTRRC
jgi:hypothetical protein